MRRFETVVATLASSVCTTAFSATTSTDSLTDPRFNVMSTRAVTPAFSVTPSTFDVWNPCSVASMRYVPWWQVRCAVGARFGRNDVGRAVRAGIDDDDRHTRHRSLRRIHHDAGNRAALCLSECGNGKSENDSRYERRRQAIEAHGSSTRKADLKVGMMYLRRVIWGTCWHTRRTASTKLGRSSYRFLDRLYSYRKPLLTATSTA